MHFFNVHLNETKSYHFVMFVIHSPLSMCLFFSHSQSTALFLRKVWRELLLMNQIIFDLVLHLIILYHALLHVCGMNGRNSFNEVQHLRIHFTLFTIPVLIIVKKIKGQKTFFLKKKNGCDWKWFFWMDFASECLF